MRVIAGEYKGRTLKVPKGSGTRPTIDRVRESLFSTLASARGGFDDAIVLDAFAGSGALGIEAISRGAAHAVFCEKDRAALAAINDNLAFVDPKSFTLVAGDVLKRPLAAPAPFDLLFFDPPYAYPATTVLQILENLDSRGQLADGALVTYEFDSKAHVRLALGDKTAFGLEYVTRKTFGTIAINIYRKA